MQASAVSASGFSTNRSTASAPPAGPPRPPPPPRRGGDPRRDVAVAGLDTGRNHPERHQIPARRRPDRPPDGIREPGTIGDGVVRRQDQQDGVPARAGPGDRLERRRGDRRRGVAGDRLQDDGLGRNAGTPQLPGNRRPVRLAANHDGRAGLLEGAQALRGGLQRGATAEQRDELFRMPFAGKRPEPCSGTAGQDDGD